MADDSFQEKTEQATQKRRTESRKEGKVPKSSELNSAVVLLTAFVALSLTGTRFFAKLSSGFRIYYQEIARMPVTTDDMQHYAYLGAKSVFFLLLPFLSAIMLAGVAAGVGQSGFLWTFKPLKPSFSKMNPAKGLKRLFSPKSSVELLKNGLVLIIITSVAYDAIMSIKDTFLTLTHEDVDSILMFIASSMLKVGIRTALALLILAFFDFLYQRWQNQRDMRMTKKEVKDEQMQAEGDPKVKSAIRSMQEKLTRQRMMSSIAEADVVITNPTHLAVALKYDPGQMGAPIVLAKGARLIAQRIKDIAKEHNIPIYENKPLARSLFKLCDIGTRVPPELFQAVAEVFAHVYQLKERRN